MKGFHPACAMRVFRGARGRRLGRCALAAALAFGLLHGGECTAVSATLEGQETLPAPAAFSLESPGGEERESGLAVPPRSDSILLAADRRFDAGADDPLARRYATGFNAPRPDPAWSADETFRLDGAHGGTLNTAELTIRSLALELPANDFIDRGPGTVHFKMSGLDVDAVRSVAGGKLQLVAAADDRSQFLCEARFSWLFEYIQSNAAAAPFFSPGDKGIFAVQGLRYGSNWALWGWGVRFELFDGISATAGYDAQVNSQQLFHIGSGGVNFAW